MKRIRLAFAALSLGMIAAPGLAQTAPGNEGSDFVQALRSGNSSAAITLLETYPNVVDFRDSRGDTPLLVAIQHRDADWTGTLLRARADPNMPGGSGETPLIAAARVGFDTAVDWLLSLGAKVDGANKMGETALIVAVQRRETPIVKVLLAQGADPEKTDTAAGYSAHDYARRDTRNPEILRLIESAHPKKAAAGPSL